MYITTKHFLTGLASLLGGGGGDMMGGLGAALGGGSGSSGLDMAAMAQAMSMFGGGSGPDAASSSMNEPSSSSSSSSSSGKSSNSGTCFSRLPSIFSFFAFSSFHHPVASACCMLYLFKYHIPNLTQQPPNLSPVVLLTPETRNLVPLQIQVSGIITNIFFFTLRK